MNINIVDIIFPLFVVVIAVATLLFYIILFTINLVALILVTVTSALVFVVLFALSSSSTIFIPLAVLDLTIESRVVRFQSWRTTV